ncbi:MAG: hypothetical protein ACLPWG_04700 [Steroidobacteraceae bacterium]
MTGSPRRLPINLLPRHGDAHGSLRRHEVIWLFSSWAIDSKTPLTRPENSLPRDPFCEVALQDLQDLHEGNIARYGLRPSEFRAWLSIQAVGTVAKT